MATEHRVLPDRYVDSVQLLQAAADAGAREGVSGAEAVMATPANLDRLVDRGLPEDVAAEAGPNDLVLLATAGDPETATTAIDAMVEGVQSAGPTRSGEGTATVRPRSVASAAATLADPGIALVSVPGTYATRLAWDALSTGLDVFLFSDGVGLEAEERLKRAAAERDRLVMGPDCGSAIVDGAPLGFANDVADGAVGVVAASGTGLQAVTSLVSEAGGGVSQAIGTGGRDLSATVGGRTTRQGIERLDADPDTDCLVVLSKPPDPAVADAVLDDLAAAETPAVVHFQGDDRDRSRPGVTPAPDLPTAARLALETVGVRTPDAGQDPLTAPPWTGGTHWPPSPADWSVDEGRTRLRGLYTGGTLCTEAAIALDGAVPDLRTNVGVGTAVTDLLDPDGDALVDLGADLLTAGRPHPMIDTTLRDEQLAAVLADDDVAVVLLDVVLGHGAAADPAGSIGEVVADAAVDVAPAGDGPTVVAAVVGTEGDPQSRSEQVARLEEAGVVVAPTNVAAAEAAAAAVGSVRGREVSAGDR